MHTAAYLLGQLVIVLLAAVSTWRFFLSSSRCRRFRSVAIVVLGDIGRSPRMMYHAESFAGNRFRTYIVGYAGTRLPTRLLSMPNIHLVHLTPPPAFISKTESRILFLFLAPFKVLIQVLSIMHALVARISDPPEFIMVQNPPSIPTLMLVRLVGWLRGSKLIIDWHNLGYTILELRMGKYHKLVELAKRFEQHFGRVAFAHVFVTKAMCDYLVSEWNLVGKTVVLHDRPPPYFHRSDPSEIHEVFCSQRPLLRTLGDFVPHYDTPNSTPFTTMKTISNTTSTRSPEPMPTLRDDRPALVVSSTSWTADEDFDLMLDALSLYERAARQASLKTPLPKLLVIVTGKGPLRDHYMAQVRRLEAEKHWKWVRCRSLWLKTEDYPILLGSADLGICLHTSSSQLDLPMKVVDMFGCRLPVCALYFNCLDELVVDGVNGKMFRTSEDLAVQLEKLLKGYPAASELSNLRKRLDDLLDNGAVDGVKWGSWNENWERTILPLVSLDLDDDAGEWLVNLAASRRDSSPD